MQNEKVAKNGKWKIDVEHRNGAIIFRSYVNGGSGWWKKFSFMIYDDFIPFVMAQLSAHLTQRAPDVCRATEGEHVWVTAADYGEVCAPCGIRR